VKEAAEEMIRQQAIEEEKEAQHEREIKAQEQAAQDAIDRRAAALAPERKEQENFLVRVKAYLKTNPNLTNKGRQQIDKELSYDEAMERTGGARVEIIDHYHSVLIDEAKRKKLKKAEIEAVKEKVPTYTEARRWDVSIARMRTILRIKLLAGLWRRWVRRGRGLFLLLVQLPTSLLLLDPHLLLISQALLNHRLTPLSQSLLNKNLLLQQALLHHLLLKL
jgi:hypothetical protein